MKKLVLYTLFAFFILSFTGIWAKEITTQGDFSSLPNKKIVREVPLKDLGDKMTFLDSSKFKSQESKIFKLITNKNFLRAALIIGICAAVAELFMPSFGILGIISLIAFILYFLGNFVAGNSILLPLIFFILGVFLVIFEIFVPGFGLPGIAGTMFLILGIINAGTDLFFSLISLVIATGIAGFIAIVLLKLGYDMKFFDKLRLNKRSDGSEGYLSVDNPELKIGDELITVTALRPSGFAKTSDSSMQKIEVISQGQFVERDKKVHVTKIEGFKIFVEEVK
ncbi:NfeD family protein [Peptoniphilus raoultii]|uniref:NfeD family protein n=1 Tax=Peptoniphilus raoultii TaxID=1776387 RepID=UPI0008D91181|nr:NfeD family protein [Peptoniphilus raoultii]